MANFKETLIWKAAFESDQAKEHKSSVEPLIGVFDKARDNASILVSEIAIDLPGYTVHDIEHLDALWEVGSQIAGPSFRINPVEGFVLGCSFLFHDAAMTMAAYPGGLEEIKASKEWKRIYNRLQPNQDEVPNDAAIVELFLREQHAVRAEKLAKISWNGDIGPRFLIDDADAREKFGDFIGQVAASHWWDYEKLESRLKDFTIPTPAPFPSSWSIDLLKLACLLRTADASQIDERRSPSFLKALRNNRLSYISEKHWSFQNKLTQAQNRNDTLYFASFRPFRKEEAKEWWLLHDTLKMVDEELRKADDLLLRCRGNEYRFSARRVANIGSAESLKACIPTEGWHPVDTAFSIADIPRLVQNLGGEQLYGHDNAAAMREAIQNAMDAIRLRQVIDPHAPAPLVEVELTRKSGSTVLTIRDNGVGMSEKSIVNNLLSFGTSGWLSDNAIGEYNEKFPLNSNVSGRYGIGFFSVFMLGEKIEIKSRRFDASPDQTTVLSFPDGLNSRPLLSGAEYTERMTTGGTELIIQLNVQKLQQDYWRSSNREKFWVCDDNGFEKLVNVIAKHFPASNVPVKVSTGDQSVVIDGSDWETEPSSTFLKRIEGNTYPAEIGEAFEAAVSLITEETGEVVGRAVFYPERLARRFSDDSKRVRGVITAHGTKISSCLFRGMLKGNPIRAARDYAIPIASSSAIQKWASEQARLLKAIPMEDEDEASIAKQVAAVGGDIGDLKFCELEGKYLNSGELREILMEKDEIWVAHDAGVSVDRPKQIRSMRTDTCISVSCGITMMIETPMWGERWLKFRDCIELREVAINIIRDEFGIAQDIADKICKIEEGRAVYPSQSPAWKCSDGTFGYVGGQYFKRNMSLEEVDELFVPHKKGRA